MAEPQVLIPIDSGGPDPWPTFVILGIVLVAFLLFALWRRRRPEPRRPA